MQCGADASQKSTCPEVGDPFPAVTVALSVTATPDDTVVCTEPQAIVDRLVVVAVCAAAADAIAPARSPAKARLTRELMSLPFIFCVL